MPGLRGRSQGHGRCWTCRTFWCAWPGVRRTCTRQLGTPIVNQDGHSKNEIVSCTLPYSRAD